MDHLEKKNIMALDIAFAATGVVVLGGGYLLHVETIKTKKDGRRGIRTADDSVCRCQVLARALCDLIIRYEVGAVAGELPGMGSLSALASRAMGLAVGTVAGVVEVMEIPAVWCTPGEGKLAMTGIRNASKDLMMAGARMKYAGARFPVSKAAFEHIADALGAYEALRHTPVIRLLDQQSSLRCLD